MAPKRDKYEVLTDGEILGAVENRIKQREQEHYTALMYLEEFKADRHADAAVLEGYTKDAQSAEDALETLYKRRDALKANIDKAKKESGETGGETPAS